MSFKTFKAYEITEFEKLIKDSNFLEKPIKNKNKKLLRHVNQTESNAFLILIMEILSCLKRKEWKPSFYIKSRFIHFALEGMISYFL